MWVHPRTPLSNSTLELYSNTYILVRSQTNRRSTMKISNTRTRTTFQQPRHDRFVSEFCGNMKCGKSLFTTSQTHVRLSGNRCFVLKLFHRLLRSIEITFLACLEKIRVGNTDFETYCILSTYRTRSPLVNPWDNTFRVKHVSTR